MGDLKALLGPGCLGAARRCPNPPPRVCVQGVDSVSRAGFWQIFRRHRTPDAAAAHSTSAASPTGRARTGQRKIRALRGGGHLELAGYLGSHRSQFGKTGQSRVHGPGWPLRPASTADSMFPAPRILESRITTAVAPTLANIFCGANFAASRLNQPMLSVVVESQLPGSEVCGEAAEDAHGHHRLGQECEQPVGDHHRGPIRGRRRASSGRPPTRLPSGLAC